MDVGNPSSAAGGGNPPEPSDGGARLVLLKPGQAGPAIFVVPGFGGSVDRLREFGGRLDTPMPVYGIEACGVDGLSPPDTRVDHMVQRYLRLIRMVQPNGPYMLIGHSFGGTVSLEMAQQLRRAGERIGCLIILDSNFAESLWPRQYRLRIMAKRLGDRIAEFAATPPQYRLLYLTHMRDIVLKKFGRVPPAMPQETLGPMAAHEIAFAQYAPAFYDGKIIFFRAACEDYPADPRALWRNRTRELEIHFATGGHLSMLDPENAATLAPKISACLQLAL